MLSLTEEKPHAPVHLNISSNMLSQFVPLEDENLNDLQYMEKLYKKR